MRGVFLGPDSFITPVFLSGIFFENVRLFANRFTSKPSTQVWLLTNPSGTMLAWALSVNVLKLRTLQPSTGRSAMRNPASSWIKKRTRIPSREFAKRNENSRVNARNISQARKPGSSTPAYVLLWFSDHFHTPAAPSAPADPKPFKAGLFYRRAEPCFLRLRAPTKSVGY